MTAQELPNGFTGFANRKPGFEPASASVGHTPVGGYTTGGGASLAGVPAGYERGAQGAFQYARDHARPDTGAASFDPDKLRLIPDTDRRWAWTEIDLNALRHNVASLKRHVGPGVRVMAVVKADGYGHGAVRCAKTALNSGAEYLGVATVNEAIELREALVNAPILVLSQPPDEAIPLLLAYKVMPSVYTPDFAIRYAEAADAFGIRAPYHLAVNTGMNRIGVRHDQVVEFLSQVSFHRALDLVGTFTHFATADAPETLDFHIQTKRFLEAIQGMRVAGVDPGIIHAANSAAAIRYPRRALRHGAPRHRALRPAPVPGNAHDDRPQARHERARARDRRAARSHERGRELRHELPQPRQREDLHRARGLRRRPAPGALGRTDFIVSGQRFRQVGNICMDQCMFEVDMRIYGTRRRVDPQIGDEVVLVGRQGDSVVTLDDMANTLGTIHYELSIGFAQRMPRVYV